MCQCKSCNEYKKSTEHNHNEASGGLKAYLPIMVSAVLLFVGLAYELLWDGKFANDYIKFVWYLLAYIPVAHSVIWSAWKLLKKNDFFNEFTLMSVATIGAFAIQEYPEGVAVMLFYSVGELLQDRAVSKARNNIRMLIDERENTATVVRNGVAITVAPEEVKVGELLMVKVGERVNLDGVLEGNSASFDASALTGESKPILIEEGEQVLSGMVSTNAVCHVRVQKMFEDSTLSRILALVEEASSRKSQKELIIRRFSKIYTPIVFLLAVLVIVVPYFVLSDYIFSTWLYRALVFLVISCPCALVISVPLGYFAGIGAASRAGILFKGANYLEALKDVNMMVLDKTGTVTQGVFEVRSIEAFGIHTNELLALVKLLEAHSTHPIAKAIVRYQSDVEPFDGFIADIEELSGFGLKAQVNNKQALAGNSKLMDLFQISYPEEIKQIVESHVLVAYGGKFVGYIIVADKIKPDALEFVRGLHQNGIKHIEMLSGDQDALVQQVANELGIDEAKGGLLPAQKLERIEVLKHTPGVIVGFMGDGINDTPAMALSDVSIAMGELGADAAIETADIVLQTDRPSHLITAIRIARKTDSIITMNLVIALVLKVLIMIGGVMGISGLWEAVFADVGVTLLTVLNSLRVLKVK